MTTGQRKNTFPGEYAPEVLTCWGDNDVDGNPEGFETDIADRKKRHASHFTTFKVIKVDVDSDMIDRLLNPKTPIIAGKIL